VAYVGLTGLAHGLILVVCSFLLFAAVAAGAAAELVFADVGSCSPFLSSFVFLFVVVFLCLLAAASAYLRACGVCAKTASLIDEWRRCVVLLY
jgi:hypothetical protein